MRNTLVRAMITVTMLAVGVGATTAPSASAATSGTCTGAITDLFNHPSGQAQLVIFYNSSNGGTNSACMYHQGSYYNQKAWTTVQIWRCTTWDGPEGAGCDPDKASDVDAGNFKIFAGPEAVTGTARRCVVAYGTMRLRDGSELTLNSGRQGCRSPR